MADICFGVTVLLGLATVVADVPVGFEVAGGIGLVATVLLGLVLDQ